MYGCECLCDVKDIRDYGSKVEGCVRVSVCVCGCLCDVQGMRDYVSKVEGCVCMRVRVRVCVGGRVCL